MGVVRDLVTYPTAELEKAKKRFPAATFGLAGMDQYAADIVARPKEDFDSAWLGCHAICVCQGQTFI